jgi:hypothetical protein
MVSRRGTPCRFLLRNRRVLQDRHLDAAIFRLALARFWLTWPPDDERVRRMEDRHTRHLTDTELYSLFDQLFQDGLAGQDVLTEIAPEGWANSPLLACFHPSVERVFEERLQMHRNLERLLPKRHQLIPNADRRRARKPLKRCGNCSMRLCSRPNSNRQAASSASPSGAIWRLC